MAAHNDFINHRQRFSRFGCLRSVDDAGENVGPATPSAISEVFFLDFDAGEADYLVQG